MKKLLFALLLLAGVATAQTSKVIDLKSTTTTKVLDTVTNSGTRIQRGQANTGGANINVTLQVVITKISGTVGGTVTCQGSLDGTNFVTIGSAATATDVASQTFSFLVKPTDYPYYQIKYVGTGTMAASFFTKLYYRPVN